MADFVHLFTRSECMANREQPTLLYPEYARPGQFPVDLSEIHFHTFQVGAPVARRAPHRPGLEGFPHPVRRSSKALRL